jgi:hypothetical protein
MIETNTVHFIVLSSWELKKKGLGERDRWFFFKYSQINKNSLLRLNLYI